MQGEVKFVQKYTDRDNKNVKGVNAAIKEKWHNCGKKDGHWINEWPDLSL